MYGVDCGQWKYDVTIADTYVWCRLWPDHRKRLRLDR
jgi:hypothetical protein